MTTEKATVQINFRADPELKKRFEEAVYDHGHRTGDANSR